MTNLAKVWSVFRGLAERDAALATRHLGPDLYVEHDPNVGDGVEGVRRYVAALAPDERLAVVRAYEVRLLVGQGDMVFLAALGTHAGAPCAYIDRYRVEDGTVMEHWGSPMNIAPAGTRKSSHPVL